MIPPNQIAIEWTDEVKGRLEALAPTVSALDGGSPAIEALIWLCVARGLGVELQEADESGARPDLEEVGRRLDRVRASTAATARTSGRDPDELLRERLAHAFERGLWTLEQERGIARPSGAPPAPPAPRGRQASARVTGDGYELNAAAQLVVFYRSALADITAGPARERARRFQERAARLLVAEALRAKPRKLGELLYDECGGAELDRGEPLDAVVDRVLAKGRLS